MWEFLLAYLKYQLLKSRERWLKAWKFVLEFYDLNLGISTIFCIYSMALKSLSIIGFQLVKMW